MPMPCSVAENTVAVDQSSFWSSSGVHWDTHRIGWAIAGACTVVVRFLFFYTMLGCQTFFLADDTCLVGYHSAALQVRFVV